MSMIRLPAFIGMIAALLLACDDSGGTPPKPTPQPPATPTPKPPPPEPEPVAHDPIARGNDTYQLYCASCHGPKGAGDGPTSTSLDPKPAKHNDGDYMNPLSDEHLSKVIKEGGVAVGKSPLMAPWGGTLSDEQVADVIAFIRSLAVPAYSP